MLQYQLNLCLLSNPSWVASLGGRYDRPASGTTFKSIKKSSDPVSKVEVSGLFEIRASTAVVNGVFIMIQDTFICARINDAIPVLRNVNGVRESGSRVSFSWNSSHRPTNPDLHTFHLMLSMSCYGHRRYTKLEDGDLFKSIGE